MRDETRTLLQNMGQWPWFEHVAEPIEAPGVIPVRSWSQAVALCQGHLWEVTRLQAFNRYTKELRARDWARSSLWNPITNEVKAEMKPLVDARVRALATRLALPEGFVHQVEWDVVGICMETEYADVYPPLFEVNLLAPWYQAGHFPCGWYGPKLQPGWRGELPPHRIHVY